MSIALATQTEIRPVETSPTQTSPIETSPIETSPIETNPIETNPARPAAECAVELVSSYAGFVNLETEWNLAVERASISYPFLRHEWVRTWWDAFSTPGARLHILVVRSAGAITAIAPFLRETTSMYGVPTRRIRFIQNDHTPRTDIIVADRPDESYRAIWRALRTDRDPWDVLQLSQLPPTSATRRAFSACATADGCALGVWDGSASPYLTLSGTWDAYLQQLPAKFRSNLRNRIARLAPLGSPTLEVLAERGAIDAGYPDACRLEASGWKRDAGTAITSEPAVHRFYTMLVERGAAAGWLRLLFLTVGGQRIATSYGACFNNRLYLFKTGYDPAFATSAPFKLLTFHAIRDAYAQGLTEVDFLGDTEPWKLEWTSTIRGHDWLFIFGNTMRARLLHAIKFQWLPELKQWRA